MSDNEIDAVYDLFDSLFNYGEFELADTIIDRVFCDRVYRIGDDMIYTVLTATLPAKSKLPSRANFYHNIARKYCWPKNLKGLE